MSQFQTHFMIYIGNLSMYYVTSVLLSIILVIVTWYMHFKNIAVKHEDKEQVSLKFKHK